MSLLAAEAAMEAEEDLNRQAADNAEQTNAALQGGSGLPDTIFVATPEVVVDEMLELANLQADDVLYDLGCGDGRIVVRAAEKYGIRTWGFDIDPARVAEARQNAKQAGVEELVTILERDIFTLDLSQASVVTLYLMPELNVRLIPQLNQMKPGSRVVSHDFDMPGVDPLEHIRMRSANGQTRHDVYLWRTPLLLSVAQAPKATQPATEAQDSLPDPSSSDGNPRPDDRDDCAGADCDPKGDHPERGELAH
jgi:SAM-dependent methyltransferase